MYCEFLWRNGGSQRQGLSTFHNDRLEMKTSMSPSTPPWAESRFGESPLQLDISLGSNKAALKPTPQWTCHNPRQTSGLFCCLNSKLNLQHLYLLQPSSLEPSGHGVKSSHDPH